MTKLKTIGLLALGLGIGVAASLATYTNAADTQTQVTPEVREERRAERTAYFEENLSSALEDGKITAEQKELILKKHTEIQANREPMYQNRGAVKGREDGLRKWMEEQGIDKEILPKPEGFGKRNGTGNGTCQNQ